MLNFIKNFAKDDAGAVTVDWVVLTAALVGLGVALLATVGTEVGKLSNGIGNDLKAHSTSYGDDTAN